MSTEQNPESTSECIHDRVRQWAERQPSAIAVTTHGEHLTYGELDARAELLAAELRGRGVGPETPVALAVPRSPDFVVGALGIMKAGGHYVPVDPAYPEHRRNLITTDAGARWTVTPPPDVGGLRTANSHTVPLPTQAPFGPSTPAGPATTADSLAYVIYTSGSTGAPKGVAVPHACVMNLIDADPRLRIAPDDVVAQLAPTAFDASVFEIWCALGNGARVALIASDEVSVAAIKRDLNAYAPDWLFLTTGLFHALMEADRDFLGKVTHVITGGDVLSPRHIRAAAAEPTREVHAAYGPTEATVFSSLHRVQPHHSDEKVPIGTALTGRSMHILDERMRPVPDGEPGEIYLGGAGLARGYLGQPGASAERFLPDPLSTTPGGRIYRTGDVGRRRSDGAFEFLDRVDRQVKIRGFRVEPAEIESFLDTCDGVDSAVVTAAPAPSGDKRLVAYVVPAADSTIGVADLRAMAEEQLPAYACPSYYALLERLPLDPNGKVDRRALPSPWRFRDRLGLPEYQPPRTTTEVLIATILAESLGLDRVGRDDDFFALGGTSLQSVQILERLRAVFPLSAREFFAHPTVASLADLLDRDGDGSRSAPAPAAAPTLAAEEAGPR